MLMALYTETDNILIIQSVCSLSLLFLIFSRIGESHIYPMDPREHVNWILLHIF